MLRKPQGFVKVVNELTGPGEDAEAHCPYVGGEARTQQVYRSSVNHTFFIAPVLTIVASYATWKS